MEDPVRAFEVADKIGAVDRRRKFLLWAFLSIVIALLIGGGLRLTEASAGQRYSMITDLNALCKAHALAILYVGDTTTIQGRFLECGTDYAVVVGMQAPEKLAQRYWIRYAAVKMLREVDDAKQ